MNQAEFLTELCNSQVPVTIYLTNGIRLLGSIEYCDQYGVLLKGATRQFLFKHAISTIVPERVVHQTAAIAPIDKPAVVEDLPPVQDVRPADAPPRTATITRKVRTKKPTVRPVSDEET